MTLLLVAAPTADAEWIRVPAKRACGPLPPGYVCSTKTQVSFGYPPGWSAFAYNDGGLYVRSLIWFGTQGFAEPIRANGLAGGWYVGGAWTLGSVPGERTTIGGQPARIEIEPRGCEYLHGDELIAAWVETRRQHARYLFRACLRGPELVVREAEVRSVLASARFPFG